MTALLDQPRTAPANGLLTSIEELRERCTALAEAKLPFGYDYETGYEGESRLAAALHAEENFIVSVQLTNSLDWARMVPLGFDAGVNMDNREVAALLWPLFHVTDDEGLPLAVPWGAAAELRWGARWFLRNLWDHPLFGRQVRDSHGYHPIRSDAMLESYAEGENQRNGLKFVTQVTTGYKMRELTDLQTAFLGRPPTEFEQNSVRFNVFDMHDPEVIAYACEDAVETLRQHLHRFPKVRRSFIYKIEANVQRVVLDMADTGVAYNWQLLREKSVEVREFADLMLAEVLADFEALASQVKGVPVKLPPDFNLNSSDQFANLLYNLCEMPVLHYTPGSDKSPPKPSTDAKKALPGLAMRYAEVRRYLDWKRLTDLRLKFLAIYEDKYDWAADGRAHPMLLQNGTVTGRFSCEAPNYQQSPKSYHYVLRNGMTFDFEFRDAIVVSRPGSRTWWELVLEEAGCDDLPEPSPHGWYMLGFDLSQVELRALAAEAGETALLEAFKRGEDVHKLTASRMLGIALSEVTKPQRQDYGKRMNFAIGYGLTEHGMAQQTGKPIEECDQLFADFRKAYPKLKEYTERVIRQSKRDGYVRTKFGRKVVIWEYLHESRKVRSGGERTAGNCVIQGPATGDYMKVAMYRALRALERAGLADRVRPVMNIHDALEWEVRKDVTPAEVIAVLQPAVIFPVTKPGVEWPPLVADWHIGTSWGQLRDVHVEADGRVVVGEAEDCPRCARKPAPAPAEPVLPAAPAPAAPEEPAGEPRAVIVVLSQVPSADQVRALRDYLKTLPGGNQVTLKIPDKAGELSVPVPFTSGLAPEHEGRVSLAAGAPAVIHLELADTVDESLADGLEV
jgi:DNA polymerase I-like protein with 3'-5' exonuclease and polymerase domains